VKMEFRRFLQAIILLPCQIVRTARRGNRSQVRGARQAETLPQEHITF
jgi:hypothetical protein